MTLEDVFQPNKFGTVPMLIIPGIGYGMLDDGYVKLSVTEGRLSSSTILPLDTVVHKTASTYVIEHELLNAYYYYIEHLVPLTAEQYLISNAVEPIKDVIMTTDSTARILTFTTEMLENMLDDGTGWIKYFEEMIPVTYYVEDILYRLDLQGKLT